MKHVGRKFRGIGMLSSPNDVKQNIQKKKGDKQFPPDNTIANQQKFPQKQGFPKISNIRFVIFSKTIAERAFIPYVLS